MKYNLATSTTSYKDVLELDNTDIIELRNEASNNASVLVEGDDLY